MKYKTFLILIFSFFLSACCNFSWMYARKLPLTEPVEPLKELSHLKNNEAWFGIILNGKKKVGFNHYRIEKYKDNPEVFKITSEAFLKFSFLGFKEQINLKEIDLVNPDLSLINFTGEQRIDDKKVIINGEIKDKELTVKIIDENITHTQKFKLKNELYSSISPYLYPVLKGLNIGETYNYQSYLTETQSLENIKQKILSYEKNELCDEPAFKVRTSIGLVSADSWINKNGETLIEMEMGGLLNSMKEDEISAKKFIYEESLLKDDILLDFSLVKTDKDISNPGSVKILHLKLAGMDEANAIISDERQKASRLTENGAPKVEYIIDAASADTQTPLLLPINEPKPNRYLKPSIYIQSTNHEVIEKSKEVLAGEKNSLVAVTRLVRWVSSEIKDDLSDSFSALNVLHSKKGECQSHTYLYTALARASGIPTKVVSGIVYMEGKGFLYHTWAESYIGKWIAVDPTFAQIPADATHIKFVEGETFDDISPLANIIGKIKAEIIEYK